MTTASASTPDSTRVGLLARIEALPQHVGDVEELLTGALRLAVEETGTSVWFALRLSPTTFGIFDAFADDEARTAHLQGKIAAALMGKAPEWLAEAPEILPVDILAAKLA
ncbi:MULTISPECIES: antibiotic biosynthesis monooxygenase [unclassified Streptomyces]|uniref:putative quinol monooxygenase n=1 Tax=unclassified Streptomyces TaxID=2593676 RepID=UPI0034500883